MYSLDIPTRKLTLDTINPGDVSSWIFDYDFKIKVTTAGGCTDLIPYGIITADDSKPTQKRMQSRCVPQQAAD
jgi:hypothetical protein